MKAVEIYQYGGAEELKYEEAETPSIQPDEVLVQAASGVALAGLTAWPGLFGHGKLEPGADGVIDFQAADFSHRVLKTKGIRGVGKIVLQVVED